jgi:1-acyl-sn-glycerol-3-phosphate acyltransferase
MTPGRVRALLVTGLLWLYFIGAFIAGYWLVFLVAAVMRGRRGIRWSLARYLGGFFALVRLLIQSSRVELPTPDRLACCRGSVVVCNHLSFLDPLLLIASIPDTLTIVRPDFFRVPIFGLLMRGAGFLGPDLLGEGQAWLARVQAHLRHGGNLLVFPEGTRSRDGALGAFKKGAFYLAKELGAPIVALRIRGTDRMFPPGQVWFCAQAGQVIVVERLATIDPAGSTDETTYELTCRIRALYESAGAHA